MNSFGLNAIVFYDRMLLRSIHHKLWLLACAACFFVCDARCFVDLIEESAAIDLNLGDDVAKKISKTSMNSYVAAKKSNGRILTLIISYSDY